jgi:hypothetical protein
VYPEHTYNLGLELAEVNKMKLEQHSNNKTSGFKLLESNMTTIDGNLASKFVYLQTPSNKESKLTELAFVKDKTMYTVTFGADTDTYSSYAPTFQKMIDSIKIT